MQGYRGNDAMNLDRWYMQMEGNIGTIMREAAVSVYGQDEARSAAIGDLLGDDAVVQRAKELAVNQSENSFVKAKHIKELQDAIDARSASYKAGVKEDIERIDDLVTAGNRTMAAILGVDVSQMGGFIAQLDKSERASVANVMDYTAQLAQRPGMDTAKMQYLVSGRMSWMLGEDGVIDSDKFLTLVDKYGAAGLPDQKGLPKTVLDFMTDPALPAGTWDPVDNLFTMYTGRDSDPVILTIEGLKEIMDAQALEDAKASISTETVPFMNGLKAIQKEVDDGYAREIFPEGEPDSGVTPGKPDAGVTIKKGKTKNKYYRTPEGVLVYTLTADGWKQTKRFTRKEWLRTRLRKEKETEPLSWFGVVQGLR